MPETIQVDGSTCPVLHRTSDTRVIVALEPGMYVIAVRADDGVWSALTGEPGDEDERLFIEHLLANTPDTLTIVRSDP